MSDISNDEYILCKGCGQRVGIWDVCPRCDTWPIVDSWFKEASASIASIRALSTQGRSLEEWKEDVTTAELSDNFFLHEMKISQADFFNDRFLIVQPPLTNGGDE